MKTAASIVKAWKRWPGSFPRFMAHLDRRQVAYLSHSKVSQVERCPQCYLNQYVLGHEPRSNALTTGTLFHAAAGALYEARRTGRPLTSASVARALRPKHPAPQQRRSLANAIKTLRHNVWDDHYEVVAVEEPFFLELAPNIPPVIGQVDLVLRQGGSYAVVDHKTSQKFADCDCGQLLLYAEWVRRNFGPESCVGAFDQYRLVHDLEAVKKAVFRRTPVSVDHAALPALTRRYRSAWTLIAKIHRDRTAQPSEECWTCRAQWSRWY